MKQNRIHVDNKAMYVKAGHRFLPLVNNDNNDISYILFRDIDSPLTHRDSELVNEWIKKDTHTVMAYSCVQLSKELLEQHSIVDMCASSERI